MAYVWAEIPFISKFGDCWVTEVQMGRMCIWFEAFRLMFKRSDSSENWTIVDNKRDPFNECTIYLYPDDF